MTSNPQELRKVRFLLFPRFQITLVAINLLVILFVSFVFWIEMQRAFSDLKAVGGMTGPGAEYYQKYLTYQADNLSRSLLFSLVGGAVVSIIVSLVLSHRFAGPLVNLRRFFDRLGRDGAGNAENNRVKFRHKDYLEDLPPIINSALDRLEKRK